MTQDFAKIKPEPLLERNTVATPPAWSLMVTGMVVGITIGVFACFLFYLSGNVPPLTAVIPNQATIQESSIASNSQATAAQPITEPAEAELQLEFYEALPVYEVPVDATPVELTEQQAGLIAEQTGDEVELGTTNLDTTNLDTTDLVPDEALDSDVILQSGAFQQLERANSEMRNQRALGLSVVVKQQDLIGRTLYLVQSGPYSSTRSLAEAELLLNSNNIPSMRLSLQ